MSRRKNTAGGAAMGGGAEFQARVAAWALAHMLAEDGAQPPFDLTSPVISVECEAPEAVDDVVVRTAKGHAGYVQAKTTVSLSRVRRDKRGRPAPLASAIDQFVRLFVDRETRAAAGTVAALDAAHDRLILAVTSRTPGTIAHDLHGVLDAVRLLPEGQDLQTATFNQRQRKAFDILLHHVQESWLEATGVTPGLREVHGLLRLLCVQVLALGDGEPAVTVAKNLFRSTVLDDAEQANYLWPVLVNIGHRLISTRARIGRPALVSELMGAGVAIQSPPSFRADVQRLRDHSAAITERLADYASIRLAQDRVEIVRPYVAALRAAAENGSMLVVGEPGAGKSGVLIGLGRTLVAEGREAIVLAAQDLPFTTVGQLRDELGLRHGVADVLANWPGNTTAFLLIDALDAARTDASAGALRQLMEDVAKHAPRWRIVAAIREYDLRYSRDLQRLFQGIPPDGPAPRLAGPGFEKVRHLVIGRLEDAEMDQLATQAPRLQELLTLAPPRVKTLLRNVFNLRLAAELLDSGTAPAAIGEVGGQLDLLNLYWDERVLRAGEAGQRDAREAVLRAAVDAMIVGRTLRIDRDQVGSDPSASPALNDLLSAHSLVEWSPGLGQPPRSSSLTFAHHVLFDYAVARLVLRRSVGRFVGVLSADPAFALLARPSLLMHFHHLWDSSTEQDARTEFWEAVLGVAAAQAIPEIGKLVGPGVAAERATHIGDDEPLFVALESSAPDHSPAENAFDHLVRSAIGQGAALREKGDLWCAAVERASRRMNDRTAYTVRAGVFGILDHTKPLSEEQMGLLGRASRRLLEHAWARPVRDRYLVTHGIQLVCRTFASDSTASASLLRRAIDAGHLAAHGSEELHCIAESVTSLVEHDPALVRDIYTAAFSYREISDAPAPMGSIVMPMVSNRRQDYEGALYLLAHAYPQFLRAAPDYAVSALNAALEWHVTQEQTRFGTMPIQELDGFQFNGRTVRMLVDYSRIWDEGHASPHEDAVVLLDHLENRLNELAGPSGDHDTLTQLLNRLAGTARLAVIWRRLLSVGTTHPQTCGLALRELTWAAPILAIDDTTVHAGDMIGAVAPYLSPEERERVERAILSIPERCADDRRTSAEHSRDRLLACIPESCVVTDEARALLQQLHADGSVPSNEHRPFIETTTRAFGEVEFLADEGVLVDHEPNRMIRELEAPVTRFATEFLNKAPDEAAAFEILPHLHALRASLRSAAQDGVHIEQANYAWGQLAEAAGALSRMDELQCSSRLGTLVREILLEASYHEIPKAASDSDAKFNDAHWGKPAARIDAAAGLATLAFHPSCADGEVLAAIDRLSTDPSPEVRWQIAARLRTLLTSSPDMFWNLIERIAGGDQSRGVLRALLSHALYPLRFHHADRVAAIAINILERSANWPEATGLHNECANILVDLCLAGKHAESARIIGETVDDPRGHLEQARHIAPRFREILTAGPTDGSDPAADAARARAFDLLLRMTRSAAAAFKRGIGGTAETTTGDGGDVPTQAQIKQLAHLLDSVGFDIYLASGAHKDEQDTGPDERGKSRFVHEAGPTIDELAGVGLPHLAHHLLEALESLISVDPKGVFIRVVAVIRGGQMGNYQYDSMAEVVLVRIVERYFAEHRDVFQQDEDARRGLVEILDTFVRAGSVEARRLSYGLDGIFR